jgi:hypothetical protein
MKYYIRKVEKITIWEATDPIELNPKFFKKLKDNPYTGSTEEDFLKYIDSLRYDLPQELEDIDFETYDKLVVFFDGEMKQKIFTSTAENEENSWLEIGEVDPTYTKKGGFNPSFDTIQS